MNSTKKAFQLCVAIAASLQIAEEVRAQSTPSSTIVGAYTSDDVNVRPALEVEMARLKAGNPSAVAAKPATDKVSLVVKAAQDLMQAMKYREALAKLEELDRLAGKTGAEIYLIERNRIALASLLGDEKLLVKSIEEAWATGLTPATDRLEFSEVLVRKYFNRKDFANVIVWSARYFEAGGKDPAIRRAQVLSFYFNRDYLRAEQEISRDIAAEESAGRTPTQEQLRLLVSCAQQRDDKPAYAAATEKYTRYYPPAK